MTLILPAFFQMQLSRARILFVSLETTTGLSFTTHNMPFPSYRFAQNSSRVCFPHGRWKRKKRRRGRERLCSFPWDGKKIPFLLLLLLLLLLVYQGHIGEGTAAKKGEGGWRKTRERGWSRIWA